MLPCTVVKDLLPSYLEHLTAEETDKLVEEHLNDCPSCREVKEGMAGAVPAKTAPPPERKLLNNMRRLRRLAAALVAVLTVFSLCTVYRSAFDVRDISTEALEAYAPRWGDGFGGVELMERLEQGNKLFVLYRWKDSRCGYLFMEYTRGLFGGYGPSRMCSFISPLYYARVVSVGGKDWLLELGTQALEEVEQYAVFSSEDGEEPLAVRAAEDGAFLKLYPLDQPLRLSQENRRQPMTVCYYDAAGDEISAAALDTSNEAEYPMQQYGSSDSLDYRFMDMRPSLVPGAAPTMFLLLLGGALLIGLILFPEKLRVKRKED